MEVPKHDVAPINGSPNTISPDVVLERIERLSKEMNIYKDCALKYSRLLNLSRRKPSIPEVLVIICGCACMLLAYFAGAFGFVLFAMGLTSVIFTAKHCRRTAVHDQAESILYNYKKCCKEAIKLIKTLKTDYSKWAVIDLILEKCREKPLHILDVTLENPPGINRFKNSFVKIDGIVQNLGVVNILGFLLSRAEEMSKMKYREGLKKVAEELDIGVDED